MAFPAPVSLIISAEYFILTDSTTTFQLLVGHHELFLCFSRLLLIGPEKIKNVFPRDKKITLRRVRGRFAAFCKKAELIIRHQTVIRATSFRYFFSLFNAL